ncbi:MAG: GAF domain-containing protein [Elainellaceae cyanobacterium]
MSASPPNLPNPTPKDTASSIDSESIKVEVTKGDVSIGSVVVDVSSTVEHSSGEENSPARVSAWHLSKPTPEVSALTTTRGSFEAFLAPLKKDTFKQVVNDVEQRLKVVNQTLSMLDSILDSQGFDAILNEMLRSITLKTGELLNADRTTIYLLDEDKNELWSIVAKDEKGNNLEFRFPATQGIAGESATFKKVVKIPFDFYDDPRAEFAKQTDQETGYRTYTMLVLPLLSDTGDLVAVVQLINKLQHDSNPQADLVDKIDLNGFTDQDEHIFEEFAPSIRLILESSRSFYKATQQQRAASALMKATTALSQSSLDLEETLKRVMDEAKELMQADRSTLWLVDDEHGELWTKVPINGVLQELRISKHAGFAGHVATTGEPLIIPFDLYEHPNADTAKETDQKTQYRTCSMLCMPVFNADGELIGVTQLINKKRKGDYALYDPRHWPRAPDCWKASFNRNDQEFMQAFNIQAGVALQNAKLFAKVKQQEQMQRDILRSLSNSVFSTDHEGRVIAVNKSAKRLLGFQDNEALEGLMVTDLIRIQEGDFSAWFDRALRPTDDKDREQYYPDRTLVSGKSDQHSVHLSINSITDVEEPSHVYGALVVMEDISGEKRLKSTMYRYMSQEVAEQLLQSGDVKLGGDRKEVSVLFSDIRSFTTIAESMDAEELVSMLNEYFEAMVDSVLSHKGILDKYIGDAIMAVFGAPLALQDHAWKAVQTGIEMRHRLIDFNAKQLLQKKPPISIGIGINSGSVISGNIGASKRMDFTAIGDGVNLGARLEGATKQYGCDIVISETTYQPCADRIWARELDRIRVKGKSNPVGIYEVVELYSNPLSDNQKRTIELYRRGREFYLQRKFTKALAEFGTILEEINNSDRAAAVQLERCNYWLQNPPPDDWDGVWSLKEK